MEALQSVLSLVVTLGILVTIHEYGHYWVARRCGVKVLRFSVGFGRPLFTWRNSEGTEFCVAAIPLGGYVRMLDEREGEVAEADKPYAFNQKTPAQRIAIAAAGPIANFAFAIFAYWLMFSIGFNVVRPVIGEVEPGSVAEQAGLQAGHEFVSVADRTTSGWKDVSIALANFVGEKDREIDVSVRYEDSTAAERYRLNFGDSLSEDLSQGLVRGIGIEPYRPLVPPVMDIVIEGGPAYRGGLLVGDIVVAAGGSQIKDWFDFVDVIKASPGKPVLVAVERQGRLMELTLTPDSVPNEEGESVGKLGVGVAPFKYPDEMIKSVSYGPFDAVAHAVEQTYADTAMTLNAIKKMVIGLLSLENLSGPITIAQVASQSISSGLEDFLSFLALLSVSLGVLNLLPIPVLDGGHILYYAIELVRGKPVPEAWQVFGLKIGLSLVLMLMVVAFYNDIMRL